MFESLEKQLCERMCARIRIHRREDGKVMLDTPFCFPDGDNYPIYLSLTDTGGVRMTDLGHTLMHFSYEDEVDGLFKGNRRTLLLQIVSEYGLHFDEKNGHFSIVSSIDEMPDALFRFGQALTKVCDLSFLSRSRVVSTFYEDLEAELEKIVAKERIVKGYIVPKIEHADDYPVDFYINGGRADPVFLYGVPKHSTEKVRLVTICLHRFIQEKVGVYRPLLVFEDELENIPQKDMVHSSDAGGDVVSFANPPAFRGKIEIYCNEGR